MVTFCSACGSLMDNDVCTNKKCSLHKSAAAGSHKPTTKKAAKDKAVKVGKVKSDYDKARRSSKCITYSIDDLEKEEDQ